MTETKPTPCEFCARAKTITQWGPPTCANIHVCRDLVLARALAAETELARVIEDAGRMHYLGNVIRARTQSEQDELTRLMRKYPPVVEAPGTASEDHGPSGQKESNNEPGNDRSSIGQSPRELDADETGSGRHDAQARERRGTDGSVLAVERSGEGLGPRNCQNGPVGSSGPGPAEVDSCDSSPSPQPPEESREVSKASSGEAAGDVVTHDKARQWVAELTTGRPSWHRDLTAYVDQQELSDAKRRGAELTLVEFQRSAAVVEARHAAALTENARLRGMLDGLEADAKCRAESARLSVELGEAQGENAELMRKLHDETARANRHFKSRLAAAKQPGGDAPLMTPAEEREAQAFSDAMDVKCGTFRLVERQRWDDCPTCHAFGGEPCLDQHGNATRRPHQIEPGGDAPAAKERCAATHKNGAGSVVRCVSEKNHLGLHSGLGGDWPNQGEDYDGWADLNPKPIQTSPFPEVAQRSANVVRRVRPEHPGIDEAAPAEAAAHHELNEHTWCVRCDRFDPGGPCPGKPAPHPAANPVEPPKAAMSEVERPVAWECSLCGKTRLQARKLFQGRGLSAVCNECVVLAVDSVLNGADNIELKKGGDQDRHAEPAACRRCDRRRTGDRHRRRTDRNRASGGNRATDQGVELAMNPDTNRFEQLHEAIDGESAAHRQNREAMQRMLTNAGKLVRPDGSPVPAHWSTFTVGERVVIKDYTFKVAYIGETNIMFEPVGPVIVGQNP